eukprot:11017472-Prorocentrum_lima.AAC.1
MVLLVEQLRERYMGAWAFAKVWGWHYTLLPVLGLRVVYESNGVWCACGCRQGRMLDVDE